MKTKQILFPLLVAGFFAACTGSNKTTSDTAASDTTVNNIAISNDTVAKVYTHYIQLKDALVKSDSVAATQAGTDLASALQDIHGCENTATIATEIGHTHDLKQQRAGFTTLSSDIIAMIKTANISSGSIFVQYCPMANNGGGGYWLASNKDIKNPYYGNEMIDCGVVKEEIKPNQLK